MSFLYRTTHETNYDDDGGVKIVLSDAAAADGGRSTSTYEQSGLRATKRPVYGSSAAFYSRLEPCFHGHLLLEQWRH